MVGSTAGVVNHELDWYGKWLSSRPRRESGDNSEKLDRR